MCLQLSNQDLKANCRVPTDDLAFVLLQVLAALPAPAGRARRAGALGAGRWALPEFDLRCAIIEDTLTSPHPS